MLFGCNPEFLSVGEERRAAEGTDVSTECLPQSWREKPVKLSKSEYKPTSQRHLYG